MGKTENDMEIYRDKETTTVIASLFELGALYRRAVFEERIARKENKIENIPVFEGCTMQKESLSRLCIKVRVEG